MYKNALVPMLPESKNYHAADKPIDSDDFKILFAFFFNNILVYDFCLLFYQTFNGNSLVNICSISSNALRFVISNYFKTKIKRQKVILTIRLHMIYNRVPAVCLRLIHQVGAKHVLVNVAQSKYRDHSFYYSAFIMRPDIDIERDWLSGQTIGRSGLVCRQPFFRRFNC